jgi:N-methylhydantoinase A/oxoprolinase/acetone carboxylase beta subunit
MQAREAERARESAQMAEAERAEREQVYMAAKARLEEAIEARERVAFDGTVLLPLDEELLRGAVRDLAKTGVDSIAVCLLFSFLHPQHERRVRRLPTHGESDRLQVHGDASDAAAGCASRAE